MLEAFALMTLDRELDRHIHPLIKKNKMATATSPPSDWMQVEAVIGCKILLKDPFCCQGAGYYGPLFRLQVNSLKTCIIGHSKL